MDSKIKEQFKNLLKEEKKLIIKNFKIPEEEKNIEFDLERKFERLSCIIIFIVFLFKTLYWSKPI